MQEPITLRLHIGAPHPVQRLPPRLLLEVRSSWSRSPVPTVTGYSLFPTQRSPLCSFLLLGDTKRQEKKAENKSFQHSLRLHHFQEVCSGFDLLISKLFMWEAEMPVFSTQFQNEKENPVWHWRIRHYTKKLTNIEGGGKTTNTRSAYNQNVHSRVLVVIQK